MVSNNENRRPFVVIRIADKAEVARYALRGDAIAHKDKLNQLIKDQFFMVQHDKNS